MLIRRFITWWSLPLLVVAVRRLVAQLAVAFARDLALVHHQIAGDESFADGNRRDENPCETDIWYRRSCSGNVARNLAQPRLW
jgi:hypothetical protein